ncbi:hypothetical protein [Roseomonas fluvialis]|uniref:Uncharacterized protein n=1 Tax=Roseomonas fluvialis TaxID=1750527 RepID=A0ABN6P5U0_9PROT|nr:hypothetical protein [Roseomonas fluvialis]BDG72979.1 hypothetical protein Rmf_29080 [Roseomonas fluvialis]
MAQNAVIGVPDGRPRQATASALVRLSMGIVRVICSASGATMRAPLTRIHEAATPPRHCAPPCRSAVQAAIEA